MYVCAHACRISVWGLRGELSTLLGTHLHLSGILSKLSCFPIYFGGILK